MRLLASQRNQAFVHLCVWLMLGVSVASAADANGPVLTIASVSELKIDESVGQAMLGSIIIRAPGLLSLSVEDADHDLLGIRIKERYVLPSGVESSFEESYAVFANSVRMIDF